ncbi:hypothetical protein [Legionella quateirensis]|uniref:Transmembrane protein n=1 Tax=Legionella quateirensis TaxID=45072 RepID=A0A378L0M7_9GAMM|nr:hypothetical protein [Legionella quateirensis]KTD49305.1 hypothetical protein Lqua_1757 [Legionella quateirensis]STY19401.1 Uncharacterised protein [Legionella quateirensis]
MITYFKKGWNGELTFFQIIFGKYSSSYLLDGGIIYIGFYVLLIIALANHQMSLNTIWLYPLLLYSICFYIWLLKAFWGSANQTSHLYSAILIRVFTILLPLFSIISFFVILIYYLVAALLDLIN